MPSGKQKLRNLLKALDPKEENFVAVSEIKETLDQVLGRPREVIVREQPVIIKGTPGEPGKTPTKEELIKLIKPLIPDPIPGKDATPVDVEKLRRDILVRLPQGGGNANRNMAVGGNTSVLSRYTDMNIKAGSNVTLTYANNDTSKYLDLTISATGGGGGSSYQQPTGAVDGSNQVFVWATAPNTMVIDQTREMQKVSSDGTVNWTGTTTTTLTVAPNSDIFSNS